MNVINPITSRDLIEPVRWHEGAVRLIDQTKLPGEFVYLDCRDIETLAEAIESLRVRGAPAIGAAAGYGLALAAHISAADTVEGVRTDMAAAKRRLATTRPTAVNLFWALERVTRRAEAFDGDDPDALRRAVLKEAEAIREEDVAAARRMGAHGAALLPADANVLTHCNAGGLATTGYGTALGVVRAAAGAGGVAMVYADETRPLLQGARLTAWECVQLGLPCTVVTDGMAGHLMSAGKVDCVVTGADRIAGNGDVANKIGTYGLAVLARHHGLPFYVAAPVSTFDFSLATGAEIPIEERRAEEVRAFGGTPTAPEGASVYNPAFDVTPAELVTALVTEAGVFKPPYAESLRPLRETAQAHC